jgi:hypothetical protein
MSDAPSYGEYIIGGVGVIVSFIAYRASKATSQAEVFTAFVEMIAKVEDLNLSLPPEKETIVWANLELLNALAAYVLRNLQKKYFFFGERSYVTEYLIDVITTQYVVLKSDPDFADIVLKIVSHPNPYRHLLALRKKLPAEFRFAET